MIHNRVSFQTHNPVHNSLISAHLDLNIEHGLRIDLVPSRNLNVVSKTFLVSLLDRSPLGLELGVVNVFEKTLQRMYVRLAIP